MINKEAQNATEKGMGLLKIYQGIPIRNDNIMRNVLQIIKSKSDEMAILGSLVTIQYNIEKNQSDELQKLNLEIVLKAMGNIQKIENI
jgi:hypothetical protein